MCQDILKLKVASCTQIGYNSLNMSAEATLRTFPKYKEYFEVLRMKTEEKLNMTMLCDFYELTMGNGYFQSGYKDRITYFDVFFRKVPDGGGFAIAAGLEQLIDYIENLHFTEEDIAYLRSRNLFCEEFLDSEISALPAISTPSLRGRPSFRRSRSSSSVPPPSRRSSLRRSHS